MQFFKSGYKGSNRLLKVYLLNDLHFGSGYEDHDLLKRIFKEIDKDRDNSRILINGDIIEGVTKQSKGDIYEQKLSPREQIDMAVDYFYPYRDLIDAINDGNHDQRITNETSIDPVEMFARYLGIKDKYFKEHQGIVGFAWNKCFYSVQMHHGVGGGSTFAAVENAMKKLWKSDSHVMYCGHWHKEFAKPIKRYAIDPYNKTIRDEKRWLVCGNTIVNTAKYAKRGGYEESYPSQAVLLLNGNKKDKKIDVAWIR